MRHPVAPSIVIVASLLLISSACSGPGGPDVEAVAETDQAIAPLLDGMGAHHRPITTDDEMVQRYFDQGLVLAYGFNHAEAARSMREAIRRDPECAVCYWGLALVLGPNINSMMDASDLPEAWNAIQKALELSPAADETERALIGALAERYSLENPEDRSALDVAYADSMREVAERYPEHTDAGTLFAEALMDTSPWDYWLQDGSPKPVTREIMATLERIMELDPEHPGANHLYIHVVEAARPELATGAADRLGAVAPGAGHLVHMPSHIYLRLGRYHEAAEANLQAIEADDGYVTACRKQGLYPLMYMPHNRHFLWFAASMEGRSEVAITAAREMAATQDAQKMREPGLGSLQHYWSTPMYAMVRFGLWEEILAEPMPAEDLVYPNSVWAFARGMAHVRLGDLEAAATELERLGEIATDPVLESVTVWDLNTTAALAAIAREVLAGELAAARGNLEEAIARLEAGVELEDDLYYDEPPPWHAPVRHNLGAILLAAGRAAEAEAVFREDLEEFPENGWGLFGLAASLEALGRSEEAAEVERRFADAWQWADVALSEARI